MGIITWATVRCIPLPKIKETFLVPSENIENLIEFVYKLLWKKLGEVCLLASNFELASILGKDSEQIEVLKKKLPSWVLIYSIEGAGILAEKKVDYQREDSMEVARSFGLELKTVIPGAKAEEVSGILSGPSMEPYWKLRYKGGCQDVFFITTLDKIPGFVRKIRELAMEYDCPVENIGVYIQPTTQGTNCHCEFDISFEPTSLEETDKVKRLVVEGSSLLAKMGAFFSRPYGPWANIVYGQETQTVIGLKKIKSIFDPKWIMNPGRLCF
jgi:FAD/FMN-containing dehydrogenase